MGEWRTHHLLVSSAESARARMDEFMADAAEAAEEGSQRLGIFKRP